MAKSRKSSSNRSEDEKPDGVDPLGDFATSSEDEAADSSEAKSPRAAVTELPNREVLLVAQRAFITRRNHPLVRAFLREEKMKHGTRKLSRADWKAAYQEFLEAPRG